MGINTVAPCRRRQIKLAIPAKTCSTVPQSAGSEFGSGVSTQGGSIWSVGVRECMSMGSTIAMAGTRPGANSGQMGASFLRFHPPSRRATALFSPRRNLRRSLGRRAGGCYLLLHRPNPLLHFCKIPCNLLPCFPLYGVESGGLSTNMKAHTMHSTGANGEGISVAPANKRRLMMRPVGTEFQ